MFETLTLPIPQHNMVTLAMKFTDVEAPIVRRQMIKRANVLLHALYVQVTIAVIRSLIIKCFLGIRSLREKCWIVLDQGVSGGCR